MPNSEPIKILVVDDLADKLLVYQSILDEPGQQVVTARSGPEALRQVLQHEFAVILLDVNMPGMDGFETATLIRGRKKCAHTPIIFVTAHTDEVHALRGYASGAVDYILTPVVPDILRTKVRVFVELFRLHRQASVQAARRIEHAEREQAHLAALLDRATDCIARVDAEGQLLHLNDAGRQMLGYQESPIPRRLVDCQPAWADSLVREQGLPIARRDGVWFGESALRTRDGAEVPVSQVILAHSTPDGELQHYSIVARDISERRRTEAELARYRVHLEELVRARTAELELSHERLRLSDRLAAIGTLAAGLGHDMGNLLLPVRMRLDALETMDLPEEACQDISAIADACEYLKRLSRGLRLFALSPEDTHASGDQTDLKSWWAEVAPFLRNALPRGIQIETSFPASLPALAISPHMLTQAVYNLVQNAGDAMKDRAHGMVRLAAAVSEGETGAVLEIVDDGPGMSPEVLRRCMEPFFTTKTRGISTGLGLALVRGAVCNAGGAIDIHSRPGEGTTFRLTIPFAREAQEDPRQLSRASIEAACVSLKDARLAAYVASLLRPLNVRIMREPWSATMEAGLVVMDDPGERVSELKEFLEADQTRRAIVLGGASRAGLPEQAVGLEAHPGAVQIRVELYRALRVGGPATEEVAP